MGIFGEWSEFKLCEEHGRIDFGIHHADGGNGGDVGESAECDGKLCGGGGGDDGWKYHGEYAAFGWRGDDCGEWRI